MNDPERYHGIVVLDKPAGMTSHDVVDRARRLFRTKRVGHTGTLDPDATGVLVLCLGQATRLAEYLSASRKHYVTTVVFGVETATQDASGAVIAERDAGFLTAERVAALLPRFRGTILQVPPMVSARHHQGKRLYELAREGVTVEREARPVEIYALEMTGFTPGTHPTATLEVTCSTGTYIRTLAADLGSALEVGGMMQTLRRTRVGDERHAFALQDAHSLEDLQQRAEAGTLETVIVSLAQATAAWPQARLRPEQVARIRNGQEIALCDIAGWETSGDLPGEPVAILDEAGLFAAVGKIAFGRLLPVKVLAQL